MLGRGSAEITFFSYAVFFSCSLSLSSFLLLLLLFFSLNFRVLTRFYNTA